MGMGELGRAVSIVLSTGVYLGLSALIFGMIIRTTASFKAGRRRLALHYDAADFRVNVFRYGLRDSALPVLVHGGELAPDSWARMIHAWKRMRSKHNRLIIMFGKTLEVERTAFNRWVLEQRPEDGPFGWAHCHPVLEAAFLDDCGVELYHKRRHNGHETHVMIGNDDNDACTVLIERPHGVEKPGPGLFLQGHPDDHFHELINLQFQIADPDFCSPFNSDTAHLICPQVEVESTEYDRPIEGRRPGTLATRR